ncbi:hypothetical protein [Dyella psychrodurans]|uniref:Uncharacterized protein n=1 Tax=Dyella psychrodurans TaxID=1927960 RepID=A0A370WY81_9GAMM|nr:hypothetical protein [Dyella psychrodurans]RDS80971.1 hypothetical protein DWU99_18125 [Dyella psychrodurans]
MSRKIGLAVAIVTLSACAQTPSTSDIQQALTQPIIDHVTVNGMNLPPDTFKLESITVLSIDKSQVADTKHFQVKANATVTLTKSGNDILGEIKQNIHGDDLGSILQLQQFVRGLGFGLKQGDQLHFAVNADLVSDHGKYVLDDGTVTPE